MRTGATIWFAGARGLVALGALFAATACSGAGSSAMSSGSSGGGSSGSSSGGGTPQSYVADLEGYSQTPRVVTAASGKATLTLSADQKTLSYHVVQGVTSATKAHIHLGAAGENGAVVYPLEPVGPDMTGAIALVNQTDVTKLDQGQFYINVHSAANPEGEMPDWA